MIDVNVTSCHEASASAVRVQSTSIVTATDATLYPQPMTGTAPSSPYIGPPLFTPMFVRPTANDTWAAGSVSA